VLAKYGLYSHPCNISTSINWPNLLSTVAARYHYLGSGKPRSIEKHALRSLDISPWLHYKVIGLWHRFLHFKDKTAPFHYFDTLWTYGDGLLLYDISAGAFYDIFFDITGKFVRRIRLSERVLIIE
jgi:hypothetical protein